MAEITIVAEGLDRFMDPMRICVAFTSEENANTFANLVERKKDKEVSVDQIPLNPEPDDWHKFM